MRNDLRSGEPEDRSVFSLCVDELSRIHFLRPGNRPREALAT